MTKQSKVFTKSCEFIKNEKEKYHDCTACSFPEMSSGSVKLSAGSSTKEQRWLCCLGGKNGATLSPVNQCELMYAEEGS